MNEFAPQPSPTENVRKPSTLATTEQNARVRSHVTVLDGIRGIAILAVLANHLIEGSALKGAITRIPLALIHAGWSGVDLFFVLSGFLITGILLDEKAKPNYFQNFYARRMLRIFPLYYAALFGVFWIVPELASSTRAEIAQLAPFQWWLWTYTSNLRSAYDGMMFNAPGIFLNHFWSLAIEEQFYLLWPAVVMSCSSEALRRSCFVIIASSLVARIAGALCGMSVWQLTAGTPFHVDTIAVGALLAVTARHSTGGLDRWVGAAHKASIACIVILCFLQLRFDGLRETPMEFAFAISLFGLLFGAITVIAVTSPTGLLSKFLSARFLRLFGRYSYGLYVFGSLLQPYLEKHLSTKAIVVWVHPVPLAASLHLVLEIGAVLVVSMLSFHLFEKRLLELKHHFRS